MKGFIVADKNWCVCVCVCARVCCIFSFSSSSKFTKTFAKSPGAVKRGEGHYLIHCYTLLVQRVCVCGVHLLRVQVCVVDK